METSIVTMKARKINLEWADSSADKTPLSLLCEIDGKMCQVFIFPKVDGDCRQICGYRLRRPHLSCRGCRLKKVNNGKIPRILEVEPYVILFAKNRGILKKRVSKLFCSLAEVFSS